ncbi:unnamed protein product [Chrysoparadoxa australica]
MPPHPLGTADPAAEQQWRRPLEAVPGRPSREVKRPRKTAAEGQLNCEESAMLMEIIAVLTSSPFCIRFTGRHNMHPELMEEYRKAVARPLDLETVAKRLCAGKYRRPARVYQDICRVFRNCRRCSPDGSLLSRVATHLETFTSDLYAETELPLPHEHSQPGATTKRITDRRMSRYRLCWYLRLFNTSLHAVKSAISVAVPGIEASEGVQLGSLLCIVREYLGLKTQWEGVQGATIEGVDWLVGSKVSKGLQGAEQTAIQAWELVVRAVAQVTPSLAERARTGTEMSKVWARPLQLVWATHGEGGFWPAMMLYDDKTPPEVIELNKGRLPPERVLEMEQSRQPGVPMATVEFFGEHSFALVDKGSMLLLSSVAEDPNLTPRSEGKQPYLTALAEAEAALHSFVQPENVLWEPLADMAAGHAFLAHAAAGAGSATELSEESEGEEGLGDESCPKSAAEAAAAAADESGARGDAPVTTGQQQQQQQQQHQKEQEPQQQASSTILVEDQDKDQHQRPQHGTAPQEEEGSHEKPSIEAIDTYGPLRRAARRHALRQQGQLLREEAMVLAEQVQVQSESLGPEHAGRTQEVYESMLAEERGEAGGSEAAGELKKGEERRGEEVGMRAGQATGEGATQSGRVSPSFVGFGIEPQVAARDYERQDPVADNSWISRAGKKNRGGAGPGPVKTDPEGRGRGAGALWGVSKVLEACARGGGDASDARRRGTYMGVEKPGDRWPTHWGLQGHAVYAREAEAASMFDVAPWHYGGLYGGANFSPEGAQEASARLYGGHHIHPHHLGNSMLSPPGAGPSQVLSLIPLGHSHAPTHPQLLHERLVLSQHQALAPHSAHTTAQPVWLSLLKEFFYPGSMPE